MSSGKRYNRARKRKLNMKKVFGVIIAIAVLIMSVISIGKLLNEDTSKMQEAQQEYYYTAYKNGKWGVINQTGNEVLPVNHEEMVIVPDNKEDIFIVMTSSNYEDGTYSTIAQNKDGKKLFDEFESVEAIDNYDETGNIWYESNCLKVKKDGKYGIINFKGELLLECEYDNIEALKGVTNSLLIERNEKVGLSSNVGDVIIKPEYSNIESISNQYSDGYIVTDEDGKSGIVGANKKIILEPEYDEVVKITGSDLYVVKENSKLKIVEDNGNTIIDGGYDECLQIYGDVIIVKKGDKCGAINKNGEEKIPFEYQELKYVLNNYYIAKKDDKYGVLDSQNNEVLAFEYSYIQNRKDTDFIEVEETATETKVYDKDMNHVLTGILSEVNTEKGYIILRQNGDWKFYNFKFEEKTEQDIFPEHTLYLSKEDGKYGYKNKNGKLVVEHIYDDAKLQNESGYCSVKKGDTWGSINREGNISQEPTVNLDDYLVIDFIGKWHYAKELEMNYYTY